MKQSKDASMGIPRQVAAKIYLKNKTLLKSKKKNVQILQIRDFSTLILKKLQIHHNQLQFFKQHSEST